LLCRSHCLNSFQMSNDMQERQNRCEAKTKRGSQCKALSGPGNRYCLFHSNPSRAAELGRKGGLRNRHYVSGAAVPPPAPQTAMDVKGFLAEAMAELRAGRLDPKIASSLAYIAGPLLK